MTDGALPFDLTVFKHVEAVPGKALLRIAGRSTTPIDTRALALVIRGEGDEHRVNPLPSPPAPSGAVRVGFTVPAELADAASGYALALPDGELAELPAPSRRQTARITPPLASLPSAPLKPGEGDQAVEELTRRLADERTKRVSAETAAATSAAARAATVERFETLEGELGAARTEAESARTEAAAAQSKADSLRSALEAARNELRAAHGAAELGRTQANHARAEADAAEAALTRRDAEIDLLRAALHDRDEQADVDHQHWEQITAELTAEIELARADAIDYQRYAADLQVELADVRLELESLQALRTDLDSNGPTDPEELRRALNAAAAELERLRAAQ